MDNETGLYIAGMKSQSFVDEPGKTVAMIYLQGCNFNCGFCHNSALIPMFTRESKMTSVEQLLESLADNFLIDGVVFTGGEPTLQPGIVDFVKAVRAKIPFVGVDTNGSNPARLAAASPHLDRVAMDFKTSLDNYPRVVGKDVNVDKVRESIDLLCARSREFGRVEFRLTYAPPAITVDDVMAVADHLMQAGFSGNHGSRFVIQQYLGSDGVREANRKSYETVVVDKLRIIATNVKEFQIPVAIRCQELGYFVV
ncbi:MAG: anaerobic ribonucleoside-triphosphate reductase activating protein [Candidatus Lokiarchaeota archaeon]|nr:anaerobic ribonucleoside-triphosphate reductase activating protein [Candidatus Lokiarchaeota archaeon]